MGVQVCRADGSGLDACACGTGGSVGTGGEPSDGGTDADAEPAKLPVGAACGGDSECVSGLCDGTNHCT